MGKYTTERAPAKITKCPHCKWTGSARGLHSHVRLSHFGKEQSLNIRKENPYVIDKAKSKVLGGVISNVHRVDQQKALEDLVMKCVVLVLKEYSSMHDPLFNPRRQ